MKNEEWGLSDHDLLITCTDEQYQKIEIDVMKSALWKTNDSLRARVEAAWAAYRAKETRKFLGRTLSENEIVAKLGGQVEAAADTVTSSEVNGQTLESVLADLQQDVSATPKKDAESKKAAPKAASLED